MSSRHKSAKWAVTAMAVITAMMLASVAAQADIINVPGDSSTIQAAIDAASNGDEIVVAPGTYFEAINFNGKAVNVHSSDGPNLTTIDGTGLMDSVVKCVGGEGGDTVLDGFTITGGVAVNGGGMRIENSNPTVMNCTFTENTATERGGGMFNSGSNPAVTNCTFTNNTAGEMAGGMQNEFGSNPTISNCTFIQNTSNGQAGGLRNYIDSHPTITNCVFFENTAAIEGGGMGNRKNSNPTVANSSFIGNIAGAGGGGMDNHVGNAVATGNPTIINCLFFGNIGGGMRNNDPSPIVTNCTFVDNIGHGMFNRQGATPQVANCIFWGNTEGSIDGNSTPNVTFSNVQGGFPGTGNIDADPLFVDNNYSLASGSPCIDTADDSVVTEPTDLDGHPRIVDGDGDSIEVVDMGALEFQCDLADDCDGDGILDDDDNCPSDANADQADADGDGVGDVCDGCPNDPNKTDPGECGCGVADTDGDGVGDCIDNCVNTPNAGQEDCDSDGVGDACAISSGMSQDTNRNGIPDECEVPPSTADLSGPLGPGFPDGCVDAFDLGAMLGAWCSGVNDPNPPSPPCENCTPANLAVADISGAAEVPDGCVDAFDLAKLLAEWCSVFGGNPCGTCGI